MSNNLLSLSPFMSTKFRASPFLNKQGSVSNYQTLADNIFPHENSWSLINKSDNLSNQQRCSPRKTPIHQIKSPLARTKLQQSLRQTPRRSQDKYSDNNSILNDPTQQFSLNIQRNQPQKSDPFASKKFLNFGMNNIPSHSNSISRDHSCENMDPNIRLNQQLSISQGLKNKSKQTSLLSPINVCRSASRKTPQNQLVSNQFSNPCLYHNQSSISNLSMGKLQSNKSQSPSIQPFQFSIQATLPLNSQNSINKRLFRKQDSQGGYQEDFNECLISPVNFQKMRSIRGQALHNNPSLNGFQLEKLTSLNDFQRYESFNRKEDDLNFPQNSKDMFPILLQNVTFSNPSINCYAHQNFQYSSPAPKNHNNYHYDQCIAEFDTPSFNQHSTCYESIYNSCQHNRGSCCYEKQDHYHHKPTKNGKKIIRLAKCQTTSKKAKYGPKVYSDGESCNFQESHQHSTDLLIQSPKIQGSKLNSSNKRKRVMKTEQKQQSLLQKLIGKNESQLSPQDKQQMSKNFNQKSHKAKQQHQKIDSQSSTQVSQICTSEKNEINQISQKSLYDISRSQLDNTKNQSISAQAIKKCTCSKSKCLKLYCECFAAGLVCGLDCGCKDCCNNEESTDIIAKAKEDILKRDPKAFEIKVTKNEDKLQHRKGCTCKKSGCKKGYCECYQLGVPCTDFCKCSGCTNCQKKEEEKEIQECKKIEDVEMKEQAPSIQDNIIFKAISQEKQENPSELKPSKRWIPPVVPEILTRSAAKRLKLQ